MLRSGFQVFFPVFFVFWGAKIDENGAPGPIRDQVGIQTPKKTQKVSGFDVDLSSLGALFSTFGLPLGWSFSVCFGNVFFRLSGGILPPKVPERVAKGKQK